MMLMAMMMAITVPFTRHPLVAGQVISPVVGAWNRSLYNRQIKCGHSVGKFLIVAGGKRGLNQTGRVLLQSLSLLLVFRRNMTSIFVEVKCLPW